MPRLERTGVALVGGSAFGRSRHNKLVFFDGDGEDLQGSTVTVKWSGCTRTACLGR